MRLVLNKGAPETHKMYMQYMPTLVVCPEGRQKEKRERRELLGMEGCVNIKEENPVHGLASARRLTCSRMKAIFSVLAIAPNVST